MKPDIAASMTEFMGEAERLHVPVIDGVAAAIKFAEAIVGMRLRTAKAGDWRIRSPTVPGQAHRLCAGNAVSSQGARGPRLSSDPAELTMDLDFANLPEMASPTSMVHTARTTATGGSRGGCPVGGLAVPTNTTSAPQSHGPLRRSR